MHTTTGANTKRPAVQIQAAGMSLMRILQLQTFPQCASTLAWFSFAEFRWIAVTIASKSIAHVAGDESHSPLVIIVARGCPRLTASGRWQLEGLGCNHDSDFLNVI
jgi:hypothetical protein